MSEGFEVETKNVLIWDKWVVTVVTPISTCKDVGRKLNFSPLPRVTRWPKPINSHRLHNSNDGGGNSSLMSPSSVPGPVLCISFTLSPLWALPFFWVLESILSDFCLMHTPPVVLVAYTFTLNECLFIYLFLTSPYLSRTSGWQQSRNSNPSSATLQLYDTRHPTLPLCLSFSSVKWVQ